MHAADLIEGFLQRSEIRYQRIDDARLFAQMRGERKLTIPIAIGVTRDAVLLESFFMRRPMEDRARFYELLMRRNMRSPGVQFALDAEGDVFLTARIPSLALNDNELDRVFGALLIEADGMFNPAIEIGFATYLAADRSWREKLATATSTGTTSTGTTSTGTN